MKKILLGITGSIAAYKTPELIRSLLQNGFEVKVILTQSAKNFVTPLTLQAISGCAVYQELLDCAAEDAMGHIKLARWADIILLAPTSANFMAKLAHGLCDDLLTTICLATVAPIILVPAMNQYMWMNIATQVNYKLLLERNILFWGPEYGVQACGDVGIGRMAESNYIVQQLLCLDGEKFLSGINILITAGGTEEPIDPVRFISNRSSGKMGYALAKVAAMLGARVTLVTAKTTLNKPHMVDKVILATTAQTMLKVVEENIQGQDIFIGCAAVSDYKVSNSSLHKIKRKDNKKITLCLEPNPDIIATIAQKYPVFTVGFAADSENIIANAQKKLQDKKLNLIIANDISDLNIGFDSDKNEVFAITKDAVTKVNLNIKEVIAQELLVMIYQQYTIRF